MHLDIDQAGCGKDEETVAVVFHGRVGDGWRMTITRAGAVAKGFILVLKNTNRPGLPERADGD
jgi:hypothetical protein